MDLFLKKVAKSARGILPELLSDKDFIAFTDYPVSCNNLLSLGIPPKFIYH